MELTSKQQEALKIALERYRNNEQYTVISGYAGVGKSTLVTFIIAALDLDPEKDVAYVSFTGKASEVLREKGNPNAMTAHKLLYKAKQLANGKFIFYPRSELDRDYKLIIVDEVGMLPLDMWNLLLRHHVHVIACGDPFQIPPILKEQDNHVLDNPHIFLDKIMRQALESDIITLSMSIREGKKISPVQGVDARVFSKKDLVDGMYFWADQILVSTNKTRNDINDYMRKAIGYGKTPEIGDKVICLRNCWDTFSAEKMNPLINGTIGYLDSFYEDDIYYNMRGRYVSAHVLVANIKTNNDIYYRVNIDYSSLVNGKKSFTPEEEYKIRRYKDNPDLPIEFNYGYAITGHRAQGSQWGKVLVLEEGFPFDKVEHARWLYTACTRAADKLTLVLRK